MKKLVKTDLLPGAWVDPERLAVSRSLKSWDSPREFSHLVVLEFIAWVFQLWTYSLASHSPEFFPLVVFGLSVHNQANQGTNTFPPASGSQGQPAQRTHPLPESTFPAPTITGGYSRTRQRGCPVSALTYSRLYIEPSLVLTSLEGESTTSWRLSRYRPWGQEALVSTLDPVVPVVPLAKALDVSPQPGADDLVQDERGSTVSWILTVFTSLAC